MALYQFNASDDEEKLAAVLINGDCTAMRGKDYCKFYAVSGLFFYVEISSGDQVGEVLKFRSAAAALFALTLVLNLSRVLPL